MPKLEQKEVKVKCGGRGFQDEEVLAEPIDVTVYLRNSHYNVVSATPWECPFNTGGYRQRCKAAHPDQDKVGNGVLCPYSFDCHDHRASYIPQELKAAVKDLFRG